MFVQKSGSESELEIQQQATILRAGGAHLPGGGWATKNKNTVLFQTVIK